MSESLQPEVFYPKRSKALWLLLGCSAFVAIGVWMGITESWIGYLCAGFFGLGLPVAIIQMIPGSAYLKLEKTGFTYSALFRKTTIPWSVVDEFFVVTLRQTGMKVHEQVGFNFVSSYDKAKLGRQIAHALGTGEGAIPDTYGMKAAELAELMNERLMRARLEEGESTTEGILSTVL